MAERVNAGAKPRTMKNYIRACDTSKHIALMCDRFQLVGWVQIHINPNKKPPTRGGSLFWRREWDSNPRYVAVSLVFKTSSLNRSDISPKIPEYYSMKNLFCQSNNKLVQTWSGFARLRASRRGKTLHRSVFRTPPSNPNSRSKKIRTHPKVSPYFWRRERDSNPRRSLSPYTISSRAP